MTQPQSDLPSAGPRLTGLFVASALVLLAVTAALTIQLTGRAVENRIEAELLHTARLIGGAGFPLNDQALERVADYIGADVVVTDASGRPVASSLPASQVAAFRGAGLPRPQREAQIVACEVAEVGYTLGIAAIGEETESGAVFVLYPADTVAAEARAAWLPVVIVALLAILCAVALGVYSERRVRAAQTSSLIRLLASVGHEVRNPLGAIRTLARTTRRRLTGDAERDSLELIASEAERLTLLVDGLRCVGLPVRTLRSEIDPDDAVRAVGALLAEQLRHRRVELAFELCDEAKVHADPAQVRQVVLNLVLNAVDAMPRGGRVRCVSRLDTEAWELAVEDEGPGVAPEARGRLFTPFTSTKPKGLGVGLYLSRRLAAANGAQLELDAEHAPGARFVTRWPTVSSASVEPSSPRA